MYNFLKSFDLLTDREIEDFVQLSTKSVLKKSDFFIREGQRCDEVAFITNGLCRSFYLSDKGEEITYCINFPNTLTTAYSSYITRQKTEENIQAISDVEMLVMSKSNIEALSTNSINWLTFQKIIAEQQYIELEKRIFQLQKSDASKRYKNLIEHHPEYIHQIPLQYLASYLGISQRHLSRIRAKITF